jgi:hypothetical protein
MRRVIAIAVAGVSLGGCSSMPSLSWDYFKPTPPSLQVQLDSTPPGADAKTLGPGCKTPCSVSVPAPDTRFSVTYTLNRFQSATIPVQVIRNPGDFATPASTTTDPNPVFAELKPAGPPPRALPAAHAQAKEAEAAEGRRCARRLAIPRSRCRASAARLRADPLNACTAAVRDVVGGLHHA